MTTDNVVTEAMFRGVALLDKCIDKHSLQRVSEYVAAVCTEAGVMVTTDVPELRRPWLTKESLRCVTDC